MFKNLAPFEPSLPLRGEGDPGGRLAPIDGVPGDRWRDQFAVAFAFGAVDGLSADQWWRNHAASGHRRRQFSSAGLGREAIGRGSGSNPAASGWFR